MPKKQSIPELKKKLVDACLAIQEKHVDASRAAMLEAQETANEQSNSMSDKFESFREMMQIDRDMYARQLQEGLHVLDMLTRIDSARKNDAPSLGAIVITDSKKFFISASLGQVSIDGEIYIAISGQSPMFKAMAGKKKGESFVFGNVKYLMMEIM